MEMVENGMIVGAEREYAKMYMDTPADNATPESFMAFAWNTECIKDVMVVAFGLYDEDLTEDTAEVIFSGLPGDFAIKCIKDWSEDKTVRERYNKYVEGE